MKYVKRAMRKAARGYTRSYIRRAIAALTAALLLVLWRQYVQPVLEHAGLLAAPTSVSETAVQSLPGAFDYDRIPEFSKDPYVLVNNNIPYFTESDLEACTEAFEDYGDLDSLGRCTTCMANLGRELMPSEDREEIDSVKPTGWVSQKGENPAIYNRCHLIGFQLAGENANEKNLITGTRALNVSGMLPWENLVADYIKETDHHVLYRVTPVFLGNELVARGVLMEGYSLEDDSIRFCVYCYNNQVGVEINYATGKYLKTLI